MGINLTFDPWARQQLIFDARLIAYLRSVQNFVEYGFGLVAGVGLNLVVGQVGPNVAYLNGYEIVQTDPVTVVLTTSITNYIFLAFTKTPDPIAGTEAITPGILVQNNNTLPPNAIKLGEVDTSGVGITALRPQNNHFIIEDSQFDTDIEGNQHQITTLVTHKGTAFPTSPPPVDGQHFFREDLGREFFFYSGSWTLVGDQATFATDGFTPTLGQTVFALSSTPVGGGLTEVSVNGVLYEQGVSWMVAGSTLTWLNSPFSLGTLDRLVARYQIS